MLSFLKPHIIESICNIYIVIRVAHDLKPTHCNWYRSESYMKYMRMLSWSDGLQLILSIVHCSWWPNSVDLIWQYALCVMVVHLSLSPIDILNVEVKHCGMHIIKYVLYTHLFTAPAVFQMRAVILKKKKIKLSFLYTMFSMHFWELGSCNLFIRSKVGTLTC